MPKMKSKACCPEERSLSERVRKLEIKVQVLEIWREELSKGAQEMLSELGLKME